jgi:hypothetical protein
VRPERLRLCRTPWDPDASLARYAISPRYERHSSCRLIRSPSNRYSWEVTTPHFSNTAIRSSEVDRESPPFGSYAPEPESSLTYHDTQHLPVQRQRNRPTTSLSPTANSRLSTLPKETLTTRSQVPAADQNPAVRLLPLRLALALLLLLMPRKPRNRNALLFLFARTSAK